MPVEEKQLELLMQESAHIHDNIQRTMSEIGKLSGFMFPAVTGLFAVLVDKELANAESVAHGSAVFCCIANLLVVAFNINWMQLLNQAAYKYSEILPKLYILTERTGQNYGQFATRDGIIKPMLGAVAMQVMLLPISISAFRQALESDHFRIAAQITLLLAIITTAISWPFALKSARMVNLTRKASHTTKT